MGQSRRRDRARRRDQRAFQGPPRLHRGRRARAADRRWPAQLSTGANPRNLLCVRTQQSAHPYRRLSTHHQSRLQRRPRAGLDLLRPAARRVLNKAALMALQDIRPAVLGQALRPNIWDVVALVLVVGAMVLIVYGGGEPGAPLSPLDIAPVSLDPANLPLYALRTTMRMLLAIVCSIIFTFIYAALAAKSRRAEMVLIPLLVFSHIFPRHPPPPCRQGPARRDGADPPARYPAIGADPRLSDLHRRLLHELVSRPRARRGTRLRVRDLHQPGLEHDLQHVSVAWQRPDGSGATSPSLSRSRLA